MRTNKHEEDLYWGTHKTLKKKDDFYTQIMISNSLIINKTATLNCLKTIYIYYYLLVGFSSNIKNIGYCLNVFFFYSLAL